MTRFIPSAVSSVLFLISPPLLLAADETDRTAAGEEILPAVVVVGTASEENLGEKSGTEILTGKDLEHLPNGTQSITESTRILPGVQLPEGHRSSENGGEIIPPEISISGGRPLQNNFTIDGLSNNSSLDPDLQDSAAASGRLLPDYSRDVFLDPDLASSVEVYRSNVSARHGEFGGGVVEAETRDPDPRFWGKADIKTTRDEWTTFQLLDEDRQDFENSDSASKQPDFAIFDGGLTLNVPTGERSGVLASYRKTRSDIPLKFLGETREQSRILENYFLKWQTDLSARETLAATVIASPYEEERFYPNSRNSDFTIDGGGTMLALAYERFLPLGDLQVKAAYRRKRNERDAPPHLFIWKVTESKPWGESIGSTTSREGMVGSIDMTQDAFQFKTDFQAAPLQTGPFTHEIAAGIDLERAEGRYNRPDDSFQFSFKGNEDVVCDPGDIACIDGEQYSHFRIKFPEGNASASVDYARLYLEDLISFSRFEIRPGLRFSFNDHQDNANVAPRLLTTYDVFDNDKTVFFAGLNRYYKKVLLSYALREGVEAQSFQMRSLQADNSPGPWTAFSRGSSYRYSQLKTPYVDEISAGLMQHLFGGRGKLQYIHRKGHNGYARQKSDRDEDGIRYYSLNNNGSSRHEEYSLSWDKRAESYNLRLNVTYQETTASNIDYDTTFDLDDLETWVYYRGEILRKSELPRDNFNRPWVANLLYTVQLPAGFHFTNLTTWRDGYKDLDSTTPPPEAPDYVDKAYELVKRPSSWMFDWKLAWQRPISGLGALTLNLEVLNVFNEKVPVSDNATEFERGRQFWAEMEYRF